MKLLITGGAGFIGMAVARGFSSLAGYDIVAVDNAQEEDLPPHRRGLFDELLKRENVAYYRVDLCDRIALESIFHAERPDCVIHTAALIGLHACRNQPELSQLNNVVATRTLLDMCETCDVSRFVMISSLSVYGTGDVPYHETDTILTGPEPFQRHKREAEKLVEDFAVRTSVPAMVLRLSNVYGPGQRSDRVVFRFLGSIEEGEKIEIQGNPGDMRDYLYIDDCVEAIRKAVHCDCSFEIVNIGGNQPETLSGLISTIEQVTGKRALVEINTAAGRAQKHLYADNSRARDLLGFAPEISLREGLRQFDRWYKTTCDQGRQVIPV